MQDPTVVKIIQEKGEINDELDFALMNYLLQNRGPGYTACQPSLVEIEEGKKAIKMKRNHALAHYNLGLIYGGQGKKSLAVKYYTAAIRYDRKDADAHNNRGLIYMEQGKYHRAVADFSRALEVNPNHLYAAQNRQNAKQKLATR